MRRVDPKGSRKGALFLCLCLLGLPGMARPQPGCPAVLAQPMLDALNDARARGVRCGSREMPPASPLRWSATLAAVAAGHSADMVNRGYFDHLTPEGRRPADRARAQGYRYRDLAENIAEGDWDLPGVVRGWLDSPGHCLNIMDGALREAGAGCVQGRRGAWDRSWTLMLGTPRAP